MKCLSKATKAYPQAAYSAIAQSLSCDWTYVQRIIEGNEEKYIPLCETIQQLFTPTLLGRKVHEQEHQLFGLPTKFGSLAPEALLKQHHQPTLPLRKSQPFFKNRSSLAILSKLVTTPTIVNRSPNKLVIHEKSRKLH